ncbi:MAG: 4Fe-4S dicluster domain-containing protein, partial [Elusimicrobia bacterium]|nr:4Fe-4S dicluster domain-containing protein [Elusimicrobiota bacterium]
QAMEAPAPERWSSAAEVGACLERAAAGEFSAALFWGVNPAYALSDQGLWRAAAEAVPVKACLAQNLDETSQACEIVLAEHHWLEAWGDYEPFPGLWTLQQPALAPLYDTRQFEDVLLGLLGRKGGCREALMSRWRREVQPKDALAPFRVFWADALHDGVVEVGTPPPTAPAFDPRRLGPAAREALSPSGTGFELLLRPSANLFDGRYGNDAWLQELPDPITKLAWGNAAELGPDDARRLGVGNADLLRLSARGREAVLPVVIQRGQASGVISAALGYGRRAGGTAQGVGVDLYPLLGAGFLSPVRAVSAGGSGRLYFMQRHDRQEGRELARSLSRAAYAAGPGWRPPPHGEVSLYRERRFPEHKWAMAVDLSACVGCQSCVLACQAENNIPTVGAERIVKGREMYWIRVDRYYEGEDRDPRVRFQPVPCQQCDDAPCENVCPVAATQHDDQGLNQMAYNRCVGTRYCLNNCPYKVRRFNFFEYTAETKAPAELVFNPEVTVRPRGVMEKCTFCIQRIQNARQAARDRGRPLADGEVSPACADACPAGAIVFGDLRDPGSRVSRLWRSDRGYRILEELGVRPAVVYLADLTNPHA